MAQIEHYFKSGNILGLRSYDILQLSEIEVY